MGGNALKQFNTVRLSTNDVMVHGHTILTGISDYLRSKNISGRAAIIPSYRNKKDHGDLDILIDFEIPTETLKQLVHDVSVIKSNTTQHISNGSARSFGLQITENSIFQVDFIYANPKIFEFALSYFSYNDCGNLIGVTAHKTGLKFGHQGLQYVIREKNHVIGEIDVDLDFESTLSFLGFDYETWENGFDDLEDIFKFIADSEYFNVDYYPLEHRSHVARVRDKKRPTYNAFLKWINDTQPLSNPLIDKEEWLTRIFDHYPQAKLDYDKAYANLAQAKLVSSKFNGDIVSRITGLKGKELGKMIAKIKKRFDSDSEFNDYILSVSDSDVIQLINWEFLT